jgi:protein CWC15
MFGPRSSYSSKDAPAHTELKQRLAGQDGAADVSKRDLKRELLEKETKHFANRPELIGARQARREAELLVPGVVDKEFAATEKLIQRDLDKDEDFDFDTNADAFGGEGDEHDKSLRPKKNGDGIRGGETTAGGRGVDSDDDGDSDSDSDEEDDEAELLAELERIKQERAEEKVRKQQEEKDNELESQKDDILKGNPLLQLDGAQADPDFGIKRRWDDDVVFRNQTRNEPKKQKRFINDTIRSDFHKRFLNKYIK